MRTQPATRPRTPLAQSLFVSAIALSIATACSDGDRSATENSPADNTSSTSEAIHSTSTTPRFADVAQVTGLDFVHANGATAEKFFPEIMGSGGAFVDYDSDGDLDVLLIQSGRINQITKPLFAVDTGGNHLTLYRNDLTDRTPQFVDVTSQSGLSLTSYGMGAAVGDLNNDGHPDIYVTDLATNALFINNGDGTFASKPSGVETADTNWSTSASFLDYDLDGNLDLFVTRYVAVSTQTSRHCGGGDGQSDYCTPSVFVPLTDLLLRGDGKGNLTKVPRWHTGSRAPSTGLGVIAADYNGDGYTDLYVANDKKANQLWLNLGDGQFAESAVMNGSAYDANGKAEASMGVTSGDVDADGDEDLFITHLKGESNTLYLNQGNAMFVDSTIAFTLSSTSLPSTGFGTGWFDADNDGDLDLFTANGAVMMERSQKDSEPFPYVQANQLFEHTTGLKFIDSSKRAGFVDEPREVSRGAAFGDIDNDGDIDILVTNNNGRARLLRNELSLDNTWINVTVQGVNATRDAAGAQLGIERESAPTLWRRAGTDDSYLSASDRRIHVGLGQTAKIKSLLVRWPNNKLERFSAPALNQFVTVTEGEGSLVK